jgi:hypothetical protein
MEYQKLKEAKIALNEEDCHGEAAAPPQINL